MRRVKAKQARVDRTALQSEVNGKRESFRDLKAFGIWSHRADVRNPVEFTTKLRKKMERGQDAR